LKFTLLALTLACVAASAGAEEAEVEVEKSTLEEIKEAVGSLDNATSLASKGKAAEEWLKAQDGAAEAAAGVAVGNMLTLLFDASNTDADGDGIPDADERDKNEDNIPDELHKGLRKAISSSVRFGEAPEGIVEGFKEFGEELLSKIKIPSVPLPRLSHFMEDLNKALADAQEELEPGLLMAYGMLLLMAVVPIFMGSHRSLTATEDIAPEDMEIMTKGDAAMFPVFASGALFTMYMCFKFFGKEYVNMVLGGYFFLLGSASLTTILRPLGEMLSPASFSDEPWEFRMDRTVKVTAADDETDEKKKQAAKAGEVTTEEWFSLKFDMVDLVCLALSAVVGVWYLTTKSWVATNLYGLSFSINGIAMFALPSFTIGCVLLCGLFFYDVFWVFGTDVMVTVARSFDAPIKVLFPKDFMENGIYASELAMLGLGDIVLPGIVVALLLRFDAHHGRASKPYFWAVYFAYIFGLVFTIVVMHTFKSAQPALLYLVPAVLLTPIMLAVVRGELTQLFAYDEEALMEEEKKEEEAKKAQ